MTNDLLAKLGILSVAAVLASAGLSGCKGDDGSDTAGDGDGDGDTETGDGDGAPGDGDGAPGDGDGAPGDGDGAPGDGDGAPSECDTHLPGDGAAEGEACYVNDDCASKVCERFQDVPVVDGACAPTPGNCATRIMGRVLDFGTGETVADANLRAVTAINASGDPVGAEGEATATSDANGVFDVVSDGQIVAPIGLVGLVDADGYFLTATGLASPADGISLYGPANTIRDLWVVPAADLTAWSGFLESDADFANQLPLGEAGGVVGLVRDSQTGDPVANAMIVPTDDASDAVIRYLNEAGDGFTTDMTSSSGIFVLVKPGLGETFGVEVDGAPVDGIEGRAGSSAGAVFTLIMNI